MSVSAEIESNYRAVTKYPTVADRVKAYLEYHVFVADADIYVADIKAASKQNREALELAAATREKQIIVQKGIINLFRGSGLMVMGNREGDILAASYAKDRDDRDLVAERNPDYPKMALRKLGQAALLQNVDARNPAWQYRHLQEILAMAGLAEDAPHYLGYASSDRFTVGASGMLPSAAIAKELKDQLTPQLVEAYRSKWVKWEHDEFAGAVDLAAAHTVLHPSESFTKVNQLAAYVGHYCDLGLNVH